MRKPDMEDVYFSFPLHQSSRNYVRFSWSGNLYEFLCLCFGLGPAPLKIPISALRRMNIRIAIYLDDMLIIGQTMKGILMSRDTVIFLLKQLGFVLNLGNSILNAVQKIEFLDVTTISLKMCLFLLGVNNSESVSGCLCRRLGGSSQTNKTTRSSYLNNSGSFDKISRFAIRGT